MFVCLCANKARQSVPISTGQKIKQDKVRDIFYTGLNRYAYSDAQASYALLRQYHNALAIDRQRLYDLKNRIAIELVDEGFVDDAVTVIHSLAIDDRDQASKRLLRYYLKHQQWDNVNYWSNQVSDELANSDRWRYWKARSLEALQYFQNIDNEPEGHHEIYQQLAKKRSFYGFLAADKLKIPYSLEDKPAQVNITAINRVKESPSIQRAIELFRLGDIHTARREWATGMTYRYGFL